MTIEEVLSAWRANCAINHEMLAMCADEDFELKPGKGKTIRSNFVHIVGVRKGHLQERKKAEAAAIPDLDWKSATREELNRALEITDELVAQALVKQEETGKPARWTAPMFLAYNVAHEANHRAQIEIALRLNGREPDVAALYGLWDWPKKGA